MNSSIPKSKFGSNQDSDQELLWSDMPVEVQHAVDVLKEKKVENIRVFDLKSFTPFFDYVLIGTVYSSAQAKVAQESLIDAMKEINVKLWSIEGEDDSNWLLVDFWDIVIHLFRPESREYYNLEALWRDFPSWSSDEVD